MTSMFLFLLLTGFAVLLLVLPYLRGQAAPPRESFDLAVHQDQLAELDRDLERGVIDAEAARAAKLEIQRRILSLAGHDETDAPVLRQGRLGSILTAMVVVAVPIASALVYLELGRPNMPDVPLATRVLPDQQTPERESMLASIQTLQERLETTPEDAALWTQLARTQLRGGLYGDAAGSYTKAIEFTGGDPMLKIELGETIVQGAEGFVTPAALEHFRSALESVPNEPRAHYYIGMAAAQEGNVDDAVGTWSQLLAFSPSDAPFRPQIISSIRGVLESNGRGDEADQVIAGLPEGGEATGGVMPAHDGPDGGQIRAMVDGLAARLEEDPDDIDGWLMLGRSRMVLEEPELAREAYERAMELAPDRPDVLYDYAAMFLEPDDAEGGDLVVGEDAVAIYEKLVTLTPENPQPRWLLGLAAAQAGEKDQAIGHWQEALGLLDEGSEDRTIVEARIAALENDDLAAAETAGTPSISPMIRIPEGAAPPVEQPAPPPTASGPQPTAEDRAEMAALSPDDREERIRGMVDNLAARLEDDPSDVEGWLRLGQSRAVLGEPEAAKAAFERALDADPDNPEVLRAYAGSLLGDPHPETNVAAVGPDAKDVYEKIIALEPDDPEAHWYLGLAAVQDGTMEAAKTHWRRVLDVLGPDHPNYAAVQSSLQQVETQTQ